ncbi:MAG: ATP-binding cassette domain-containing protein [Anaerolineae bacterium]|nr:ATP-binding cassette domain-containing protein [Anaerolineae bacterium]
MKNVSYAYPLHGDVPIPALRNLSLSIEEGEYVAVVGANGSGKSTLARHLNALLVPDVGRVHVAGMDTREFTHHPEIHRLVGMVFQRPEDQIVATTALEDVAFGPENLSLPADEIRERVREALDAVGLWEERDRPPHMLSAGQMQRLALAGVLAMRPRCIVFDEVTAMLDPAGRRAVRAWLRRFHREGMTVITITHFMEEAAEAGRIIVLDRGRLALDGSPETVFADPAQLEALGLELPPVTAIAHELRLVFPGLPTPLFEVMALADALPGIVGQLPSKAAHVSVVPAPLSSGAPAPLLVVRALGHVYMQKTPLARTALHDVALSVAQGEVHGLLGATGSGKSTLMQHLNGLLRPQTGAVRVGPFDLNASDVDVRAVRRYAGLSFQMPEMQIFEQYVGDEIAYGPRLLDLPRPELRERVRWAMTLVGLDFEEFKDRLTFTLSGGEKRKVALAATLSLQPQVLLLDEPTAGLDPVSRRELLGHLRSFREAGMTLVLSSHQMEDLAILAQRMTVLDRGASVLSGTVPEIFSHGTRLDELGLEVPAAAQVAEALRARGWPVPPDVATRAVLLDYLRSCAV